MATAPLNHTAHHPIPPLCEQQASHAEDLSIEELRTDEFHHIELQAPTSILNPERLVVRQLRITGSGDLYCHPHEFAIPFSEWNTLSPAPLVGKRFRWF